MLPVGASVFTCEVGAFMPHPGIKHVTLRPAIILHLCRIRQPSTGSIHVYTQRVYTHREYIYIYIYKRCIQIVYILYIYIQTNGRHLSPIVREVVF
jgi:hypothetical protein